MRMVFGVGVLLGAFLLVLPFSIPANEAQPLVDNPAFEARLASLGKQLRCLVCQGQSIAESDSGFANDIKREMLRLMKEGRSDSEIIDFLVQRYGDFILFRPPMKTSTALLWLGPFLLLLIAGSVLFVTLQRRRRLAAEGGLSDEEMRRAEALLHDNDDGNKS